MPATFNTTQPKPSAQRRWRRWSVLFILLLLCVCFLKPCLLWLLPKPAPQHGAPFQLPAQTQIVGLLYPPQTLDIVSALLWRRAIKPARKALKKKYGGFDDDEKDALLDGFGGLTGVFGAPALRFGVQLPFNQQPWGFYLLAEGQFVDASAFNEWFSTIGSHHQPRGEYGAWTLAENETTLAGCRPTPKGATLALCQKGPQAEAYFSQELPLLQPQPNSLVDQILYQPLPESPSTNLLVLFQDVFTTTPWVEALPPLAHVDSIILQASLRFNQCPITLTLTPRATTSVSTLVAEIERLRASPELETLPPHTKNLLYALTLTPDADSLTLSFTLTPTLWTELWDEWKSHLDPATHTP